MLLCTYSQNNLPPQKIYQNLFEDVQMSGLFESGFIFANAEPKRNPKAIVTDYNNALNNPNLRFSMQLFLKENFLLPKPVVMQGFHKSVTPQSLEKEWPKLFKMSAKTSFGNSIIPLPFPYVIPGGYLQQMQYEDAYFLMVGLLESGNKTMVENMVTNFSQLITKFNFIPKGNRSYFLTRSQLPYFSLMLDLLAEYKGNKIYALYQGSLQKEYDFWMHNNQVVEMPDGSKLNRYYAQSDFAMDEDYARNMKWGEKIKDPQKMANFFRDLSNANASGWYMSSRWMDSREVASIHTSSILPVDLNCFIYYLEATLSKAYKERGDLIRMNYYSQLAEKRKQAIQKYFYNKEEQWYCDYDLLRKQTSSKKTLAGLTPMYFELVSPNMAKELSQVLIRDFLKSGGLQSTLEKSGFRFDAPIGFASQQYIAVQSLLNYQMKAEAGMVAKRWIENNSKQLEKTGKLFGYYSVTDATEIPDIPGVFKEDGYGVTLAILIKMLSDFTHIN